MRWHTVTRLPQPPKRGGGNPTFDPAGQENKRVPSVREIMEDHETTNPCTTHNNKQLIPMTILIMMQMRTFMLDITKQTITMIAYPPILHPSMHCLSLAARSAQDLCASHATAAQRHCSQWVVCPCPGGDKCHNRAWVCGPDLLTGSTAGDITGSCTGIMS